MSKVQVTQVNDLTLPTGTGSAGQVLKNGSTAGTLEFGDLPDFTSSATQSTTSGSSHTITGLSTSATLHMISLSGVSTDTSTPQLSFQIGNGSLSTSGYAWSTGYIAGTTQYSASTSSVRVTHTAFSGTTNAFHGVIYICCNSAGAVTGNWVLSNDGGSSPVGGFRWTGGTAIDRFSLQAAGNFDAGAFKIHSF